MPSKSKFKDPYRFGVYVYMHLYYNVFGNFQWSTVKLHCFTISRERESEKEGRERVRERRERERERERERREVERAERERK